jgi:hypothetical protein
MRRDPNSTSIQIAASAQMDTIKICISTSHVPAKMGVADIRSRG